MSTSTRKNVTGNSPPLASQASFEHADLLDAVMIGVGGGLIVVDEKAVLRSVNAAAKRIFGYQRNKLCGKKISVLLPNEMDRLRDLFKHCSRKRSSESKTRGQVFTGRQKNGKSFSLELTLTRMKSEVEQLFVILVKEIAGLSPNGNDFDETKQNLLNRILELEDFQQRVEEQAAQTIQIAESLSAAKEASYTASKLAEENMIRVKTVFDTVTDGIITLNAKGIIESANPSAVQLLGRTGEEIVGMFLSKLVADQKRGNFDAFLQTYLGGRRNESEGDSVEFEVPRRGRSNIPAEMTIGEMLIGKERMFTCVLRNISERKKILKLALNDSLTGLANRNLFHQRLGDALQMAQRLDRLVALMILDLDDFKNINDNFGHPIGDGLLKKVAQQLTECCRTVDTVARLGGDEFAIILVNLEDTKSVSLLAERVINRLSRPITVEKCLVQTGTSIGISLYPHDDTDVDELIRKADLALYQAKAAGRGVFHLYHEDLQSEARAQRILENDLRLALARGEFLLHYQAQLGITGGQITGAEALLRWNHPSKGMLAPGSFIPSAESSRLIVPIGEWVLREACAQNKAWQELGLPPFRVAVNISTLQFSSDDLVRSVEVALDETGLDPKWLELEITETMVVDDADQATKKLERLHKLGVSLAIDDFGVGYSSLTYLKRFPVQRLKIDQSFVRNLIANSDDAAITEAVINLGHSLDLSVVAEGAETKAHVAYLREKGCDEVQGFYFCRPLPAENFPQWVMTRSCSQAVEGL